MSTQHPDNAAIPFFATSQVLAGEDEIRETYYAFSHLMCDEQMWDGEGKEIDTYIVRKLLSYYPQFFEHNVLGEKLRLTLRVPNPTVESAEAKVLLEMLESIPRSFDTARIFYKRDIPPVFEVILPMTTSADCVNRVYNYYREFIAERQFKPLRNDTITVAEWIGSFEPQHINVIPLFEDAPTMLQAATIVEQFLADKNVDYQRVFLARSDTAMNYGLVSAALANKIALQALDEFSKKQGIPVYPILGMGSAPFRGGLTPNTVQRVGNEYPSVATFTTQSAFKYDFPLEQIQNACNYLKQRPLGAATPIDRSRAVDIIERFSNAYQREVVALATQINAMARFVPARRARKLHIGLFGYARGVGGVTLPRAISFTCAMYSMGFPPEFLGLDTLTRDDIDFIRAVYPSFHMKLSDAFPYADLESPLMNRGIRNALEQMGVGNQTNQEHLELTRKIRENVANNETAQVTELITRAALLRRFLG